MPGGRRGGGLSGASAGPEVVPLAADDLGRTVALWAAAGLVRPWNDAGADYRAALRCPTAALLGVRDGHALAAAVMAGFDGHRGWLYYLAVAPGRRGQGLGRALVAAAEAWLRAAGAPKVQLMVRDGNDAAGFYPRLGYEPQAVAVWGRRLEVKA